MQHLPKLLVLLKIHVQGFYKLLGFCIFVIFANVFKIIFSFDIVFAQEIPTYCHRSDKWKWHRLNSIVFIRIYIKISGKIVSLVALCKF